MADGVIVDVSQALRFATQLGAAHIGLRKRAGGSLKDAAEDVEATAVSAAPVLTGELVGSSVIEGSGLGWVVGFTAAHAIYQELGTSRHGPQPFLFPAANRAELPLFSKLEDDVGEL